MSGNKRRPTHHLPYPILLLKEREEKSPAEMTDHVTVTSLFCNRSGEEEDVAQILMAFNHTQRNKSPAHWSRKKKLPRKRKRRARPKSSKQSPQLMSDLNQPSSSSSSLDSGGDQGAQWITQVFPTPIAFVRFYQRHFSSSSSSAADATAVSKMPLTNAQVEWLARQWNIDPDSARHWLAYRNSPAYQQRMAATTAAARKQNREPKKKTKKIKVYLGNPPSQPSIPVEKATKDVKRSVIVL